MQLRVNELLYPSFMCFIYFITFAVRVARSCASFIPVYRLARAFLRPLRGAALLLVGTALASFKCCLETEAFFLHRW